MDLCVSIRENRPCIFAKFGDGEYNAIHQYPGGNCDGTPYTPKLGHAVKQAFLDLAATPHAWLGKWEGSPDVATYFNSLVPHPVAWTDYHSCIFKTMEAFHVKRPLYSAIRHATQQTLYICNPSMAEGVQSLLHVSDIVLIDPVNWFELWYTETLAQIQSVVQTPESLVILTSAGMGAKPLLADLARLYPRAILIDIGSALDHVCSLQRTRDYHSHFTPQDIHSIHQSLAL